MVATTQILKKLQLLQKLIGEEDIGDEVIEVTISKLLSYEFDKLRGRQNQTRERLTAFEEDYRLKTEEFARKFREGTMGDAMDFFGLSHGQLHDILCYCRHGGTVSARTIAVTIRDAAVWANSGYRDTLVICSLAISAVAAGVMAAVL